MRYMFGNMDAQYVVFDIMINSITIIIQCLYEDGYVSVAIFLKVIIMIAC